MSFGLLVRNSSNNEVIGSTDRTAQLIKFGNLGPLNLNQSVTVTGLTGFTSTNSSEFEILSMGYYPSTFNSTSYGFTITRGTNQVTFTNTSTNGLKIQYFAFRY
tara:strand:+ start:67 stop:378 length:312 start_codon:yes stop_codon:yes gene_type:complete